MTEEHLEALMVRVTDEVASPAEREELMAHLANRPDLRRELDAHRALKAATDGLLSRLRLDAVEDDLRAHPLQRSVSALGTALVVGGLALLAGGGLTALMLDAEAPLWARLGTGALGGGLLVLFATLLLSRLRAAPHDKYTEVLR